MCIFDYKLIKIILGDVIMMSKIRTLITLLSLYK